MQNILTGIYSRYSSSTALKAALPGKMHLELAPQGTAMTHATYFMVSGRPDYMLTGTMYEVVTIQFDIYAATNALRLAAYAALIALYDDARPTATGYTSILMERTNQQMVRDGEQNEIYRAIVTYECRYLKS
jgi:hypothetical protein